LKKYAKTIEREIKKIVEAIHELDNSVKITGDLDQSGALIVGTDESWQEAAERREKKRNLLERKVDLEELLSEVQERED